MNDGTLIHEKGLEMVRNIYNDLLKTADYRGYLGTNLVQLLFLIAYFLLIAYY
jgi:hypothetical protein